MSDYNLRHLSSRSFEQLIQAIATEVIGPDIIIFGDGPDGAREATFEGSIPFPNEKHNWKGYGVVQAKFLQRPKNSKEDGDWALGKLKSELEKFVDPDRDLRKPEYYIFATNVVLTPVKDKGSKDKATNLIESYQSDLPLKDWDIWDYDKICKFLDIYEGIRQSYSAWVMPGDVLSKVIKWIDFTEPNFNEIITNYLQKELLADQFVNLEQAGHTIQDRIPLAKVFIDLPTFNERRIEPPDVEGYGNKLQNGFLVEILDTAQDRLDPKSLNIRSNQPSLDNSKQRTGRYVLIGGPGQGKTTIGQFICQLFRASLLENGNAAYPPEVNKAIELIQTQSEKEGISLPVCRRFPIHISLNNFAAKLASDEVPQVNSLLSYIVYRIRKLTDQEITVNDFRKWLSAYPWVIVLDGLDEVPASSNRTDLLEAVQNFWIDSAEQNADVLVITTTRPQGYNKEYSPELYKHKWLAPLSNQRAMHYGERLADVRYGIDKDRYQKVIDRLERSLSASATSRLMRSPLQVTIMSTLVDRIGRPPQDRWRLFNEYYNVIYQREMERPISAASVLRDHKPDIDAIHSRVGLLLQIESEKPGRTDARLTKDRFSQIVEQRLSEEGHRGNRIEVLKQKIIDAAMQRLVFLVGVEANRVGFEIRSLQEFMASEGIMNSSDESVQERLREISSLTSWRNIFLFAAGKCFADRQHLRDTIHTICSETNEGTDSDVFKVTLAGSRLALDLLEDGPAQRQPKYTESLARIALRLLDLPPDDVHTRLADLYNPGLESVYKDEIQIRLKSKSFTHGLAAWQCLFTLVDANTDWAKELLKKYFPQSESEQIQLLDIAFRSRDGLCVITRLEHLTFVFPPRKLRSNLQFYENKDKFKELGFKYQSIISILHRGTDDDERVPLIFSDMGKSHIRFYYSSLDKNKYSEWDIFQEVNKLSPEWLPFAGGARFIKDPSQSALANELRKIATKDFRPNPIYELLPWPMAACLISVSDRDELMRLADRVQEGDLGDYDDWTKSESRWQEKGISEEDIYAMVDTPQPFDKSIRLVGFPFGSRANYISSVNRAGELIKRLLEIHSDLPKSEIRSQVASWLVFILSFTHREMISQFEYFDCDKFGQLIKDSGETKFVELVFALSPDSLTEKGCINILDSFGKEASNLSSFLFFDRDIDKSEMIQTITDLYIQDPSRVGLLRILSKFSMTRNIPNIPSDLLINNSDKDIQIQEAKIILCLNQSCGDASQTKTMAETTSKLMKNNPEIAKRIIRHVKSNTNFTELYMLYVLGFIDGTDWKTREYIINKLNESLDRYTSNLMEYEIWNKLGFPISLFDILRQ